VKTRTERTEEQEIASGRSESTPWVMLGSVVVVMACLVAVVLSLVILAFQLA
jgi:hypothetical protein